MMIESEEHVEIMEEHLDEEPEEAEGDGNEITEDEFSKSMKDLQKELDLLKK